MASLTVLGIGNILMQDDGVGVRVMEAVRDARDWPDDVEFIDGGAGGLNLLNIIESAEHLVVFDSAEMNLPAGEHRIIHPRQVAEHSPAHRVSLHDVPFIETLRLCETFSQAPDDIVLLAIQPDVVDFGRELTPALSAALGGLTAAGVALIAGTLERLTS